MKTNSIVNANLINVGKKLIIPKKESGQTLPSGPSSKSSEKNTEGETDKDGNIYSLIKKIKNKQDKKS